MGRELKRVPLNFNWPINIVWGGYLNPFYKQSTDCPHCGGSGSSPESKYLTDLWYGKVPFKPEDRGSHPFRIEDPEVWDFAERNVNHSPQYYGTGQNAVRNEASRLCELFNASWSRHINDQDVAALIKAGRLMDFTHTWKSGDGWKPKSPAYTPTAQEVNKWSLRGLGHDSINCWVCVKAELKRLGQPSVCSFCGGKAAIWPSPKIEKQSKNWKPTNPPKGDGYQLWETVSEGSPISPVFATAEELATYLAFGKNEKWASNDRDTSYEQWMKFINGPGWAPSAISDERGFQSGVNAVC